MIISGTRYNAATDTAQSPQGCVDKETQRGAMRLGESEQIIAETALNNLAQEEAPVLVHHGAERVENWLFVRLENAERQQV